MGLGIATIFLACGTLRDHFYRLPNGAEKLSRPNLYEICVFQPALLLQSFV